MGQMLEFLKELLDDATERLPGVTNRRAFGSWGYYVEDRIFALAYAREDRLGVKLPDEAAYASARGLAGANEWAPHGSPMSDWVLLPEEVHDDREAVAQWVTRAFQLVRAMPANSPRKAKPRTQATKPSQPNQSRGAAKLASATKKSSPSPTKKQATATTRKTQKKKAR